MLHNLQQQFKASLLEEHNEVTQHFNTQLEGLTAEERLAIYRNTMFVSLKQVLFERFETVTKLVGDDFMRQLCHAFIKKSPPRQGSLLFYGEAFPNFIKTAEGTKELGFVTDMAALEWQMHQSFHSADERTYTPAHISELNFEAFVEQPLKLAKHMRLCRSNFAIYDIWKMAQDETQQPKSIHKSQNILIYRDAETLDAHLMEIDDAFACLLTELQTGHPLSVASEKAAATMENFNLQSAFEALFEKQLISKE